jgi:hypothetical protein
MINEDYIRESIKCYREICKTKDDCKGCPIIKFCGSFDFPKDFTDEDIEKITKDLMEFVKGVINHE